ncbi:hypothetical protein V8F06_007792 [Rhypophila decipiens]
MEAAVQFIETCEVSYRDSWTEALETGTMDTYLAVLLLNLPSIDHLRIEPVLLVETEFVGRVLRSYLCDTPPSLVLPADHPGSLQGLRDLCLDRYDYSPIPNTPNILPVFYLASVKKMSIYIDDPADEFQWPTESPPQALGLESLEVEGLSEAQLGNLLSATPCLRSLTYTREFQVIAPVWVGDAGPLVLGRIINLDSLGVSLAVVKDTLAKLEIRTRGNCAGNRSIAYDTSTDVRFEGPTRSLCLAEFHHLKFLQVPSEFIMGFPAMSVLEENLPPNIEELAISTSYSCHPPGEWDYDSSYVEGILRWLADAKQHMPNIRKFSYLDYNSSYFAANSPNTSERDYLAAKARMKEVATRAGIEYCTGRKQG